MFVGLMLSCINTVHALSFCITRDGQRDREQAPVASFDSQVDAEHDHREQSQHGKQVGVAHDSVEAAAREQLGVRPNIAAFGVRVHRGELDPDGAADDERGPRLEEHR